MILLFDLHEYDSVNYSPFLEHLLTHFHQIKMRKFTPRRAHYIAKSILTDPLPSSGPWRVIHERPPREHDLLEITVSSSGSGRRVDVK